jgi:hypothetical protein
MRLKIRCDGECEKFCKIFRELNWAYALEELILQCRLLVLETTSELCIGTAIKVPESEELVTTFSFPTVNALH